MSLDPRCAQLHADACARGDDTYTDPITGRSVFTALFLSRRRCCGNGCRHCPHRVREVRLENLGN